VEPMRVLIVDDDDRFRWRLAQFLATVPDIEMVGEVASGHEALVNSGALKPDLVLMDVRMPGMDGVTATRLLKEQLPNLKVIVLSVYDLKEYKDAALASGASAYVIKKDMIEKLIPAIRNVLRNPR
jgi:DNA-binding NarL/FixJ family response regulator